MTQQLSEFVFAEAVVRTTRVVPDVAAMYGGRLGEIATYGRGGRVLGVRIHSENNLIRVEVHIIARYHPTLVIPKLADAVRVAIRQQLQALSVSEIAAIDIVIDDVQLDTAPEEEAYNEYLQPSHRHPS